MSFCSVSSNKVTFWNLKTTHLLQLGWSENYSIRTPIKWNFIFPCFLGLGELLLFFSNGCGLRKQRKSIPMLSFILYYAHKVVITSLQFSCFRYKTI